MGKMLDGKFFLTMFAWCTVGIFLGMGVAGAAMGASYLYEKNLQCPHFAKNVERPYKYDWFAGGCFVQTTTDQWVAERNY